MCGPGSAAKVPGHQLPDRAACSPPREGGASAVVRPARWPRPGSTGCSAKRLSGEADQGAARAQVSITQRDGRRCRAVTSTRRARLGSIGACSPIRARWLTAASTPRAGRTQLWILRLGRRLPAGRYTATVRRSTGTASPARSARSASGCAELDDVEAGIR
jgi:hypothetical protein